MQNILWESFQKNWTSMQDIPLDARPPQQQGLQRIPAGSGVLTFPLWSYSWPSSVRPHSSPLSSLFHSLNSFLMFREASHQANRLWGSRGLRYRKRGFEALGGRGVLHKCLSEGELENMSGFPVAPSCLTICQERERKASGILEILAVSPSNVMWADERWGLRGSICLPGTFITCCLLSSHHVSTTVLDTAVNRSDSLTWLLT